MKYFDLFVLHKAPSGNCLLRDFIALIYWSALNSCNPPPHNKTSFSVKKNEIYVQNNNVLVFQKAVKLLLYNGGQTEVTKLVCLECAWVNKN